MSRFAKVAIVGSATAALGLLLTFLHVTPDLEEHLGLPLLFGLRGARPAPAGVVVVSIDKESAEALGLPGDPAKWPRSFHARLTDKLTRAGAAVIVFDIFFDNARPGQDDHSLSEAVRRAGNVVLSQYLQRESLPLGSSPRARAGEFNIERVVPPLASLEEAAAGSAPFPLPKVPVRLNQYWTFKTGAGGRPTLPVVAVQVFARDVWGDFVRLLDDANPVWRSMAQQDRLTVRDTSKVQETISAVRDVFQADSAIGPAMLRALDGFQEPNAESRRRELLYALIRMYSGPDSQYLNFYGPPGTITTIPYSRVVTAVDASDDFLVAAVRGKAVFVGMSEYLRPEQKDGFYTVFSKEGGVDLSGVEVAATAFANLLDDSHVRPLGVVRQVAILIVGGWALALLGTGMSPARAVAASLVASVAYVIVAQHRFTTGAIWYPVIVPLLAQVPFAFVTCVLWRYADANRERQKIRKAFSYYLPNKVIDELISTTGVRSASQLVYGICLFTDAERYTSLAERLPPYELARLMNAYYATIFEPVKRHGGIVSDVVGDAALAIWATAEPSVALRIQACLAACDITDALDRFNASSEGLQLPTRIGLHAGPLMLGNVGAIDHYEYRAVGDIVNTATRVQALNKHLGTRILASDEVVGGLDGFVTRKLGTFLLAGKSKPIVVHELLCRKDAASQSTLSMSRLFAEGLTAYEKQAWHEASETFAALMREYGSDGPSRFYLRRCAEYESKPPDGAWDSVVHVDK